MLSYIVFAFCIVFVASMRLKDVEEGDCRGVQFPPVPDRGIDFVSTVPSFRYIPAGSAFELYHYASGHPRFAQMQEFELRDNMCTTHNGTDDSGMGTTFGFGGRALGTYRFTPRRGHTTVFDFSYLPSGKVGGVSLGRSTLTITLTDYKTFVFFAICKTINSSEQKSWVVLSLTPNLSASTRQVIANHAASLGFNRDNFLFLNFDTCEAGTNQKSNWRNRGLGAAGNRQFSGRSGWRK